MELLLRTVCDRSLKTNGVWSTVFVVIVVGSALGGMA